MFLALTGIFVLLILSVFRGVFVFYPLLLGLVLIALLARRRGHSLGSVLFTRPTPASSPARASCPALNR